MLRWYDLSNDLKHEMVARARITAALLPDLELMKQVYYIYDTAFSDAVTVDDVAVNIALELEAYDRALMGPGRRELPEFERWRSEQDELRAGSYVYIIIDDTEYPL